MRNLAARPSATQHGPGSQTSLPEAGAQEHLPAFKVQKRANMPHCGMRGRKQENAWYWKKSNPEDKEAFQHQGHCPPCPWPLPLPGLPPELGGPLPGQDQGENCRGSPGVLEALAPRGSTQGSPSALPGLSPVLSVEAWVSCSPPSVFLVRGCILM